MTIWQGKLKKFDESNFFHPRVFESVVADYLNSYYGHETTDRGKPHYRGPLNWKPIQISNSIQCICCDIHEIGNRGIEYPSLQKLIFLPISPGKFIKLNFHFGGTCIATTSGVNPAPMFELTESIIRSIKLNVGPETQAEWNKVKADIQDMSFSEAFGELKWPIKPEELDTNDLQAEQLKIQ